MTARQVVTALGAGCLWGGLAYLIGVRAFPHTIEAGVIASPLIGLSVAALLQPLFERRHGFRRSLVALGSLGLSATLFGLVLGTYDWATGERSHQIMAGVILQAPMAVLWGVFLGGLWLILWPLAYFTHFMIQWLDETQSGWSAS